MVRYTRTKLSGYYVMLHNYPSIHIVSFCFPKIWSFFRLLNRLCVVRVLYFGGEYLIYFGKHLFLEGNTYWSKNGIEQRGEFDVSLGTHRIILSANSVSNR